MSSPDASTAPEASPHPPRRRRKATLFCPECGHESPVDGSWEYRSRIGSGFEEVRCPTCRTRVSERPLPDQRERGVRAILRRSHVPSPGDTLVTLTRFWSQTVTAWLDWPSRSEC